MARRRRDRRLRSSSSVCLYFPALFYTVDHEGSGIPLISSSADDQGGFRIISQALFSSWRPFIGTFFFSVVNILNLLKLKKATDVLTEFMWETVCNWWMWTQNWIYINQNSLAHGWNWEIGFEEKMKTKEGWKIDRAIVRPLCSMSWTSVLDKATVLMLQKGGMTSGSSLLGGSKQGQSCAPWRLIDGRLPWLCWRGVSGHWTLRMTGRSQSSRKTWAVQPGTCMHRTGNDVISMRQVSSMGSKRSQ